VQDSVSVADGEGTGSRGRELDPVEGFGDIDGESPHGGARVGPAEANCEGRDRADSWKGGVRVLGGITSAVGPCVAVHAVGVVGDEAVGDAVRLEERPGWARSPQGRDAVVSGNEPPSVAEGLDEVVVCLGVGGWEPAGGAAGRSGLLEEDRVDPEERVGEGGFPQVVVHFASE
jgi:hypothetical protein